MRKLAICAALLGGCGPATEDEGDVSWVLGTFSTVVGIDSSRNSATSLVFNSDRTGRYVIQHCGLEGGTAVFDWRLRGGLVMATAPNSQEGFPLEDGDFVVPLWFELRRAEECVQGEPQGYDVVVAFFPPESGSEPDQRTFYKSNPCISAPINNNPPDPCPGMNNECGVPDICELTWCDDTPPLPCEP